MTVIHELTDADIKHFLETAPLYSWREFKRPHVNRASLWIKEIDAFCEVCKQSRPFHESQGRGRAVGLSVTALASGTSSFSLTCVSCRADEREYYVEHRVGEKNIQLQKYGELPRLKLSRDRILQTFLKDDLANYEKAIVCLQYEYGVGAFAYFRRVVENHISNLLDLVQEDARASGNDSEIGNAIGELRKDSPMSEKIKIANLALPNYLKPDGLNPLGRLYQVLSDGIHSLSETECLQRAKATSESLSFLVSELASRKRNRERFKMTIGKL